MEVEQVPIKELLDSINFEFNIDTQYKNEIEGEIDDYTSFIYNIDSKEYSIVFFDMEEMEELFVPIIESDFKENFTLNKLTITNNDFNTFKSLIDSLIEKGEI